jgi:hypothetical protein
MRSHLGFFSGVWIGRVKIRTQVGITAGGDLRLAALGSLLAGGFGVGG